MAAIVEYGRDIFQGVFTVLKGMGVTWNRLFKPGITLQYPVERWEMPERSRMRLFNKIEDCIGCGQCARACPVDCIFIDTEKREKDEPDLFASDGTAIKLRTTRFDIDMTLCCYCNLCTYPCPTHCLYMTDEYEYSAYDKSGLLYRFAVDKPRTEWTESEEEAFTLTEEEAAAIEAEKERKKAEAERKKKEAEAKKKAAEAKKAAAEAKERADARKSEGGDGSAPEKTESDAPEAESKEGGEG